METVLDAGIDVSADGVDWTRAVTVEASEAAGFALGPGGVVAGYTLDNPTYAAEGVVWEGSISR